jgi:hypothetical protein
LTIFHYHLLTGGITQVIGLALQALLTHGREEHDITLVCGREEQSAEAMERIRAHLSPAQATHLRCELLPEIDYLSELPSAPDPGSIADQHPEQQMVFHIHDFPESGRYSNLAALEETVRRPLYPVRPNVRYAVINTRDRAILLDSGIPTPQLYLLNNPVTAASPAQLAPPRREALRRWLAERAPRWEEHGRLLIYPVRSIRRKNVMEAALSAKLLREPCNLVVTLPGNSAQEQPYSTLVERCFSDGLVPGAWGVGTELDEAGFSFAELLGSADGLISSAVQEGFGYLFIDAVRQRLPLIARELDILEGIRPLFSDYPAHFYRRLTVPLEEADATELGLLYRDALEKLRGVLPTSRIESLRYEVEELLTGEAIDFSYLSVDMQRRLLERSDEEAFLEELRRLNPALADAGALLDAGPAPEKSGEIEAQYGPAAHAAGIERILDSFGELPEESVEPLTAPDERGGGIGERVLARFSSLENLRLLYFQ